jgi:predicted heme/steroid binding protein
MTSSSFKLLWVLAFLVTPVASAWGGLGESEGSISGDRMRMRAFHSVVRAPQYSVHELKMTNGSRIRQYVAANGRIFAVSWHTLFKPDLSSMLGSSFPSYSAAVSEAAHLGGIRRQFRHQGSDLVVQSSGHLNVYNGYAIRPSLVPQGLNLQTVDLG